MPENVSYAYTVLSDEAALELNIDGAKYKVVQLTMRFTKNGIPECTCMVAIGRNARRVDDLAQIHKSGLQLFEMKEASITFKPQEDWKPGKRWDNSPRTIFDGYYVGMAYRKVNNKVQAIIHLAHWCMDLGFSSCLHRWQHPTNPTNFVFPAIVPAAGNGMEGKRIWLSHYVNYPKVHSLCMNDIWAACKTVFCNLASNESGAGRFAISCGVKAGTADTAINSRALLALKGFEVDADECMFEARNEEKEHSSRLLGASRRLVDLYRPELIHSSIALGICHESVQTYITHTFWDILIAKYCAMFDMAVIPLVNRCLVTADAPYWRADNVPYRTITPSEYNHLNLTGRIAQPLQAVGVLASHSTLVKLGFTEPIDNDKICLGGHYAVDAESQQDGVLKMVQAPSWLASQHSCGRYAKVLGVPDKKPTNSGTTNPPLPPLPPDPEPGKKTVLDERQNAFSTYAKAVYCQHHLRTRGASFDGKLRFDIGPGSIVKLEQKAENASLGIDELAVPLWGQVQSVTININAEARRAGTSFSLTHVRTDSENGVDRTSAAEHPLFGTDIFKGGPLLLDWEFDES